MPNCDYYMDLISAELDDALTEAEKADLYAHLSQCENCRRYRDALLSVEDALENDLAVPPATLAKSVMARVEAMPAHGSVKPTKKTKRRPILRSIRSASLVAVAVFAIWAGVNIFSPKGSMKGADHAAPAAMDMAAETEAAPAESMAEDSMTRAMGAAEPTENSPAEAALPMEAPAEAPMAMLPDTEESTAYAAECESSACVDVYKAGELLLTTDDEAFFAFVQSELMTAAEPMEIPESDVDYTLTLFYPGGNVEYVALWLSGENLYWLFDGEETAFRSSVIPADFLHWIGE